MVAETKRIMGSTIADLIFRGIALASIIIALILINQSAERGKCQAQYNEANSIITRERAKAAEPERIALRDALDKLGGSFTLVLQGDKVPRDKIVEQFLSTQAALNEYKLAGDRADQTRELNPLPDLPSSTCY